jgi:hypothetical protein
VLHVPLLRQPVPMQECEVQQDSSALEKDSPMMLFLAH